MEFEKRLWTKSATKEDFRSGDELFQMLTINPVKAKKPTIPVVAKTRSKLESDPEQACEENDSIPMYLFLARHILLNPTPNTGDILKIFKVSE